MPLRGSPTCTTFDVSTRKVPSLALMPRGHLNHSNRAKKKVAGAVQFRSKGTGHPKQRDEDVIHTEDTSEDKSSSPPQHRHQQLSDTLEETPTEEKQQETQHCIKVEEEEEQDNYDDGQAELRLGERFLKVMALMARLSTQSLGVNPTPTSPSRLTRTNTERSLAVATERILNTAATASSPPQMPPKSPKHTVHEVAKRLPRALQGPLTFDICMLLPTPLDERQSPLKSPIRRKRLRKRVRRRRLRRRARRTWQASHASWPPHASAEYIVDHTRQDIAGINADRLVKCLNERKVNVQTLPRVLSMPLPSLRQDIKHVSTESVGDEGQEEHSDASEDDVGDAYYQGGSDVEGEGDSSNNDEGSSRDEEESNTTPLSTCSDNSAAVATSSPREDQENVADKTAADKKRPLYHQPAWISPELHAWLVASGLFATKPSRELLSTGL